MQFICLSCFLRLYRQFSGHVMNSLGRLNHISETPARLLWLVWRRQNFDMSSKRHFMARLHISSASSSKLPWIIRQKTFISLPFQLPSLPGCTWWKNWMRYAMFYSNLLYMCLSARYIRLRLENGQHLNIIYVGQEKAYDRRNREKLWVV